SSGFTVGSPNYPASMRMYLGGSQTFSLSSEASIAGNLYDAAAPVSWSSEVAAYGAIIAGNFDASSNVTIHYDREAVDVGRVCPPEPGTCKTCTDCNNQACVNGTCGACTDSSQCCAPLQCIMGTCKVSQCIYGNECGPSGECPTNYKCQDGCCLKIIM